jgi:hypothetical protein
MLAGRSIERSFLHRRYGCCRNPDRTRSPALIIFHGGRPCGSGQRGSNPARQRALGLVPRRRPGFKPMQQRFDPLLGRGCGARCASCLAP